MYFDTLRADYREQCRDPDFHIENKQRLNLSREAAETILRDSEILGERRTSDAVGKLTSTVLNHIFRCFYEEADASVEQGVQRLRVQLAGSLEAMADSPEKEQAVELLVRAWRQEAQKSCTVRLKKRGISVNFRIDQGNLEHLVSENCQTEGPFYKNQVGEYIKAILEEYAELPYVRREQIYCREVCDEIRKALVNRNLLKITLHSVSRETGLHNVMYMKPYEITTDPEHLYNYITGFCLIEEENLWRPTSVRLSSVLRCEVRLSSGFLSARQIRELEQTVEKYGVQYLANRNAAEEILVRFTPAGERLYGRLLHLRPAWERKGTEPRTYIFTCSPRQAENYFFKFGADAEILRPAWLRQRFQEKYREALEAYTTEREF